MKKEWKNYLERLMIAMNLSKEELKDFDIQIQKDFDKWKKECRVKQGEQILKDHNIN